MLRWFDHHCHIPYERLPDGAIEQARAAGVARMITVGTDIEQSRAAIKMASSNDEMWATAGVHPHEARHGIDGLAELLDDPLVVAVGECGLDYHYDHSPRDVQHEVFIAQIGLANERDLPLVIHTREAWDDTFTILDREGVPASTIIHCFTGGPDEAKECLARGAMVSFSGIVTFKNSTELHEAAVACPLDRLLVETDAPFLAPVPHRGKPNVPANVVHVGERIAELKQISVEAVSAATWENTNSAYRV